MPLPSSSLTPGKSLMALVAVFTAVAPYLADWSETHVLNPNWPPHARFHNGQTMSTGLFIGVATLYYLFFAPIPSTPPNPPNPPNPLQTPPQATSPSPSSPSSSSSSTPSPSSTYLNFALVLLHLYYVPALSGILYPGARWMDPEFGDGRPQLGAFVGVLGAAWVGWGVEGRRLRGRGKKRV
ncbi:hypothetical protein BDV95DRAFT_656332 [Massariosphaeria phaeospora]|uniref:Uncharacterized protein n=1 Tax=Massariosphaeria phaeospora TaxID=100035 RepID=A0A7C8MEP6_9PLEO|nr:hypothetical protein BDV95DRAFT_656332 [Massariosphaeria phaeospora]